MFFTCRILGHFPNGYSYSKCLAEHLVIEQMKAGLPCMICRPSIGQLDGKQRVVRWSWKMPIIFFFLYIFSVIPIWTDPLPGWTDNLNGPMGLLTAAGKGVLCSMYGNPDSWADFIPVDLVVHGIQVSTWNYIDNKYVDPQTHAYFKKNIIRNPQIFNKLWISFHGHSDLF